jgi:hypothetical protein
MSYSDDQVSFDAYGLEETRPIRRLRLAIVDNVPYRLYPYEIAAEMTRLRFEGWSSVEVRESHVPVGMPFRYEYWGVK